MIRLTGVVVSHVLHATRASERSSLTPETKPMERSITSHHQRNTGVPYLTNSPLERHALPTSPCPNPSAPDIERPGPLWSCCGGRRNGGPDSTSEAGRTCFKGATSRTVSRGEAIEA